MQTYVFLFQNKERGNSCGARKDCICEWNSDKISQRGGGVHCVWWSQTDSNQVDRSWGFELWQVSTGWHPKRHYSIYHILRYTSLCDVWSFGVLAWEIFSKGGTPYQGMTNTRARELIDSGYRMPAPDGTPDEVYQLMLRWSAHQVNIYLHWIWTSLRLHIFSSGVGNTTQTTGPILPKSMQPSTFSIPGEILCDLSENRVCKSKSVKDNQIKQRFNY